MTEYKLLHIRHTCFVCGKKDNPDDASVVAVKIPNDWTEEYQDLRTDNLSPVTLAARCERCKRHDTPDSKPYIPVDPAAISPPIGGYET